MKPEGVKFLCALVDREDVGLVREVARGLCNLGGNYETHSQLMADQVKDI